MNFTSVANATAFGMFFGSGPPEPNSRDELQLNAELNSERKFVNELVTVLSSRNAKVFISKPDFEQQSIHPDALRYMAPSRLRLSIFDTLDYRLADMAAYNGASIWVNNTDFKNVSRYFASKNHKKGGSPGKPKAKEWFVTIGSKKYFKTNKYLFIEMEAATGERVDGATIRRWKKELDKKPT